MKFNTDQAQQFCKTKIKDTNAYRECAAGLPGIDWKHFYEMCWHDIEVSVRKLILFEPQLNFDDKVITIQFINLTDNY